MVYQESIKILQADLFVSSIWSKKCRNSVKHKVTQMMQQLGAHSQSRYNIYCELAQYFLAEIRH